MLFTLFLIFIILGVVWFYYCKPLVIFDSKGWIVTVEALKVSDTEYNYQTNLESVKHSTDLLVGITSYTSDFRDNEDFIQFILDNQDMFLEDIAVPFKTQGLLFRPYNFIVSTDFMLQHKTIKITYDIAVCKAESYYFFYKKHVIHIHSHIVDDSLEKRLQLQKLFESFELT